MYADKRIDPARAWTAYQPDAQRPWDLRLAGHLYRRAAFGGNWRQLQQAVSDGPKRTIDRLLHPEGNVAGFNARYDDYEGANDPGDGSAEALREWWLRRMIETPHPLQEMMTFFWHNYFAASELRVSSGHLMQQHVQLLRTHALGKLPPLLEGLCQDAAMLLALRGEANRKAQPSDPFARQLLVLLGLGPSEFNEQDVRDMARAFTGWFVIKNHLRYLEHEHDPGNKRIFGQEGPWKADDVARLVLRKPAVPRRVVRRLYRWLISETDKPSDELLAPLAESFAKDLDMGRLVETVLRSNLFFSPTTYRGRIKGPVEFAVGFIRAFEAVVPTRPLGRDLADLGQDLGSPPTMKGWIGGRAWINDFTVVGRTNLAAALLAGVDPYGDKLNPGAVLAKYARATPDVAVPFLVDLLLQGDVTPEVRQRVGKAAMKSAPGAEPARRLRELVHLIAVLPEYQLS